MNDNELAIHIESGNDKLGVRLKKVVVIPGNVLEMEDEYILGYVKQAIHRMREESHLCDKHLPVSFQKEREWRTK